MPLISRGFHGRRRTTADLRRVPRGQYVVDDFPVLSAGPTPRTPIEQWSFAIDGEVPRPVSWSFDELQALPAETFSADIHCVTRWSKLDTSWTGISLDALLAGADPRTNHVTAWCDGGYTTNLELADITAGRAWIAYAYDGRPLMPEHGGPARLLVPHLYLWKSAKWIRGLTFTGEDQPGFWEAAGYNNHGDPWKEQRYWGD